MFQFISRFYYSFGAYSSVSPFCLTFGVCSYELDEIALSPNLEKMVLFKSGLCVDSGVGSGGFWDAVWPEVAISRWCSLVCMSFPAMPGGAVLWVCATEPC